MSDVVITVRGEHEARIAPGDRPWLEGVAAEVAAATDPELTPRMTETEMGLGAGGRLYQGDVVSTPGTFPRWFTELNKSGEKVTREIVERTARKLLAGAPLGAHEGRIALAMMDEAREILAEGAASEDAIDRLYETSQRWPKGPCRVDREDADVVGADAWPELTVAAFAVPLDAEEFRPPERAHG